MIAPTSIRGPPYSRSWSPSWYGLGSLSLVLRRNTVVAPFLRSGALPRHASGGNRWNIGSAPNVVTTLLPAIKVEPVGGSYASIVLTDSRRSTHSTVTSGPSSGDPTHPTSWWRWRTGAGGHSSCASSTSRRRGRRSRHIWTSRGG